MSTPAHTPSTLDRRVRAVSAIATLVVALAAGILSFAGLAELGQEAGMGSLAVLLPVAVDGLVVAASAQIVAATASGISARGPWAMVIGAAGLSVTGNAIPHLGNPVSVATHAVVPILFVLSMETLAASWRRSVVVAHRQAEVEAREAERARRAAERSATPTPKKPATRSSSGYSGRKVRDSEVDAEILGLHADGLSLAKIAERTGVSRSSVHRVVSKAA